MQHDQFQDILDALVKESVVGQEVLGEVLARASLQAPKETSRLEISAGNPTARRPRDQRALPPGTVSRAVNALMTGGLLEAGETYRQTRGGRTLAPLRLGRGYAIAGVKVEHEKGQPRHVTTALLGLDSTQTLGTLSGTADSWDDVADLVHRHVVSLKKRCDKDSEHLRDRRGSRRSGLQRRDHAAFARSLSTACSPGQYAAPPCRSRPKLRQSCTGDN